MMCYLLIFPNNRRNSAVYQRTKMLIFCKIQYLFGKVDLPWTQDAFTGYGVVSVDRGLKEPLEGTTHGATMWMQIFISGSGGALGASHVQEQWKG
jgi:hypothetical protein